MNTNEVYLKELIGKSIKVKNSPNMNNVGINGKIIDESRNMIAIDAGNRVCNIPKTGAVFRVEFGDGWYDIQGDAILLKPEDRTKEKRKIYKKLRRYDSR
ncbi:ribonuclease P protein subunit [Ferroplasma sp.]|uniref:ribonuclease P protein component 1 n=1 Tax=Ferroplasma sp. TaxID=2591003 RepID=UPI002625174A|nr:ribonuclease P protein subunit [Ferroplasma sp.]MCL4452863.1 ribonuclease P protein subunit [Candidatus Thermoplasmatota archaeon]